MTAVNEIPEDVLAAALKLHAGIMGLKDVCCDGVPEAVRYAYEAGLRRAGAGSLNDLAAQAHQISVDKGFWSMDRDPGEILMLIVTELAEAMEAIRDGLALSELFFVSLDGGMAEEGGEFSKPVGFPSELADTLLRVLDACGAWGIDIQAAVEAKMRYNASRPYLHGRTR